MVFCLIAIWRRVAEIIANVVTHTHCFCNFFRFAHFRHKSCSAARTKKANTQIFQIIACHISQKHGPRNSLHLQKAHFTAVRMSSALAKSSVSQTVKNTPERPLLRRNKQNRLPHRSAVTVHCCAQERAPRANFLS